MKNLLENIEIYILDIRQILRSKERRSLGECRTKRTGHIPQ